MKVLSSIAIVSSVVVSTTTGFTVVPQHAGVSVASATNTQLSMGLFDMFSDEARQAREAKREAEIKEQERLQKEMLARRTDPEKMGEYERKVAMRRQLRMAGMDEEASNIDVFDEDVSVADITGEPQDAEAVEEEATVA